MVNELKILHSRVAKEYTYNPLVLESLAYEKYGVTLKDDYAEIHIDDSAYPKLLLAGLIAEMYILTRGRGRLKQLTISIIGEEGCSECAHLSTEHDFWNWSRLLASLAVCPCLTLPAHTCVQNSPHPFYHSYT